MTSGLRAPMPRTVTVLAAAVCGLLGTVPVLAPQLALPAIAGCLAVAVLAIWPDAVTPAVIFLIVLDVAPVLVDDHGVPQALGVSVPLLLAVPFAYRLARGERVLFTSTFMLLLAYLAVQVFSASLSAYPETATHEILTFGLEGVLSFFLITNVVRTPRELRRAVWAVVAAGSLLAAVTLLQNLTHTFWRTYGGFSLVDPSYYYRHVGTPRAAGPVGDPNYYAQVLLVPLALALLMWRAEGSRRGRLAAAGAAAVTAVAVVLTSSRGAALAFLAIFAMMVCLRYVSGRQLAGVAAGMAALIVAFPTYRSHVATVAQLGGATAAEGSASAADVSIQGRAAEMRTAALVFEAHPLMGVGPDAFPLYYQQYVATIGNDLHATIRYGSQRGNPDPRAAHDMFLSIAAEVGIVGLVAFLAVVAETVWTLVWARRRLLRVRPDLAAITTGLLLAVSGYLIAGLFLTLAYERYFWLVLALSAAAGTVARAEVAGEVRTPR